jgi:anti-sigma factor RsiW
MSCERASSVLHGYFDGELDAVSAAEFELHLERCGECVRALEELGTLRSSINAAQLYHRAPNSLRRKVLAEVGLPRPVLTMPSRKPWAWLALAAAILLCSFAGWQFFLANRTGSSQPGLTAELIDAHLRSLQPGHLTDVISSDQHTVKPWFAGKLDFSPPVRDFADQGFPLKGGRLDIIRGRATAALVYGRRKHVVNVFIWPIHDQDDPVHPGSQQGYQWVEWHNAGMEFYAVSDASSEDLEQLHRLFTE